MSERGGVGDPRDGVVQQAAADVARAGGGAAVPRGVRRTWLPQGMESSDRFVLVKRLHTSVFISSARKAYHACCIIISITESLQNLRVFKTNTQIQYIQIMQYIRIACNILTKEYATEP